ncbi:Cullin-domain-containing protein [Acrodontium crateriforme]|uniref:Cullin-domain-containing protein n=1 Tax=Acrodontium crateriforme TaxID=150365 RepID=A0AAQ3M8Z4_9PEZI|nr:Cullin-domain-containing protein [Acrodontium crateriforme]
MASHAGRGGRTKIRAPRRGLNGADVDFDAIWTVLEKAFREIHTKNASQLSFEELYRNAYKIVLKKKGEELYNKVADFEQQRLGQDVRTQIVNTLSAPLMLSHGSGNTLTTASERLSAGNKFLKELQQSWDDHQVSMGMLTDVLMYMDRVYCADHRQPSIFAKSMSLFRDEILRTPVHADQPTTLEILTHIILDQISMDRDGHPIDQSLVKKIVYMLEGLYESVHEVEDEKLYLSAFEAAFLETSAEFYKEEGERLLKESDAGAYCRHAKRRIDEETNRCRSTLSEMTTPKIQQVVEDELIRNKMKGLIEMDTGVQHMVDNDRLSDLALIFELESRVDARKPELTKAMQKIITDMGKEINKTAETASTTPAATGNDQDGVKAKAGSNKAVNQQTVAALKWVEEILALRERFENICKLSFTSDQTVTTAINRSMAEVINLFHRGSEYISLFIDDNMKKGIKNKSEAEVDATLEKAIIVVRYLADKDVFETYYKKHLCKRLLLDKSQSIDVEKQMISRMKIELGNSFTLKLEAMFKDMTLSEELTTGYRRYVANLGSADPRRADLGINVLTSMTWPLEAFRGGAEDSNEARTKIIYPPVVRQLKEAFEHFYSGKHSGRKLTWQSNMGTADLKATFPRSKGGKPRTHDVSCSTYAMIILLLFNDLPPGGSLSLEEIEAKTNIPKGDLTRNLQSLAVAPKTRFLVKEPMSRDVKPGDRFSFNDNFKSDFVKIKVGVVSAGNKVEGDRERKVTDEKTNEGRGFVIEAAVVRIMKQRKELSHAQLLSETISIVSAQFIPDVNMIKKRIESLIEREYLERLEDAPVPSYRYLA